MLHIHCLGDSITQAVGLPECGRWTALLQQALDAARPGTFAVYNHGVGGNTSALGLDRMNKEVIGKDITLLQFGLNDCSCQRFNVKNRVSLAEYEANLRAMMAIVRARGGQPVLVANHRPDYANEPRQPDGELYSDKIARYNDIVRSLATECAVLLIDMEAHLAAPAQAARSLRADGLHLNIEGNQVYAQHIFESLKENLLSSGSFEWPISLRA